MLVFVGLLLLFFDLNYYLMTRLPGTEGLACVPGGNVTAINITFAVLLSILSALMFSAAIMLTGARRPTAGIAGVGAVVGTFTVFCTTCSLPFISLFGLSVGLGFFTTYNLAIKIISLVLILVGLYYLEKQLQGNCKICKK